ncbi:RNA-binding domain-containing protein [Methanofollis ethanolicus]|uniref:RNA-binding domain-containing protein n=1 Tax=Methanofollis ethanolicus TaxID=488124 RepID=UPI00082A6024|nr:RNA-binding domain-containing protein [Methanofollis ethanolicus]
MSGDLKVQLQEMLLLPAETECIEFKEARNNYDFDKIGKYFSALSNEANLNGKPAGWLIFGVTDRPPREVVGSHYRLTPPGLDRLKEEIAHHTNHRITFAAIHELTVDCGRVVMFEIPPCPRGIPTTWKGVAYGRSHESLEPLALYEMDQIHSQPPQDDWSAKVCEGATLADLDPEAIAFAREKYKEKHQGLASEVDEWDDSTFLAKAKVCPQGRMTNAAIILLGKSEAAHLLSPAIAHITWVLRDKDEVEVDYAHFGPPLILAVDRVFHKVRNLTIRHISGETLFPLEVSQYDPWVIREALHNCIAHQDYRQSARITVTERPGSLMFTNRGEFIPGTVLSVIERDVPPDRYRNPFLANAMVELKMIDTIGSGIKRMFRIQRDRNFPMPDYDLDEEGVVRVTIPGRVIDEKYTRMLVKRKELTLTDVIALDKVQKGHPITPEERTILRKKKLIEGRYPNLYVSESVAAEIDTKADYIRKRPFDRAHFKSMVVAYLRTYHEARLAEIEDLLLDKVSDALNEDQRRHFIKDLLQEMRKEGTITTIGKTKGAKWVLTPDPANEV